MRSRSRLNKSFEKKQKKTIILSVIGIIVILFILFKFGISALINFSLFLSGNQNSNTQETKKLIDFVAPPVLNPLPIATNSANIIISGTASKDSKIYLFINGKNVADVKADENGSFNFEEKLFKGNNIVKTKSEIDNTKSEFSNSFEVIYKNAEPKLEISTPNDGQSFKKDENTANVSGTTESGVTITVNGFWAVLNDENIFSYKLPLKDGDNEIKIVATDEAGNKSEKTLKVNYSQ